MPVFLHKKKVTPNWNDQGQTLNTKSKSNNILINKQPTTQWNTLNYQ